MGLFGKKSEEEELVNDLVGGFLGGKLYKLSRENGLQEKVDDNNDAIAISEDIKNILEKKVKNDNLPLDEIELYFYFIFKQAMYINQNLFFREGYCSHCKKDMEDDKYHIFSCPRCGKEFFDSYIIDYDELDKIEIKFIDDDNSPYRDLGDDLSNYIQKRKPNSNYEKVKKCLPKCLDSLGVSDDEYYLVETLSKINSNEFGPLKLSIMAIYNDKFSFVPIAEYYNNTGYVFYEDHGIDVYSATDVNFNEIAKISFPSDKYSRIDMANGDVVLVQYLKTKTSLEDLVNKFDEYLENPQQMVEESIETEVVADINPMQKLKEAKELLDMGAISQEEFDELKAKYMELI